MSQDPVERALPSIRSGGSESRLLNIVCRLFSNFVVLSIEYTVRMWELSAGRSYRLMRN